ncbi:MAG: hypothetical protein JRD89_08760 [Deltaproteobacteria bacterium]|nr:hypothetical protein [Deltaproteobacteria bacterium]
MAQTPENPRVNLEYVEKLKEEAENETYDTPEDRTKALVGCETSFVYFLLRFANIVETSTTTTKGGTIKFELWPHLLDVIWALKYKRFIVILKARQIGISWLLAAYALWYALFHDGATVLLFSKGEEEAMELLGKARRMYNQLPDWLRLKLGKDALTEMEFPDRVSKIKAFASTPSAGISYTASVIIADEWEYHPYAVDHWNNAKPTVDAAGAQWIGCSTVDKRKPETLMKSIYKDAKEGRNNFYPLFFPWNVRPSRSEGWLDEVMRSTPEKAMEGMPRDLYREQNYPASEEEALRPSRTIAAVDLTVVDDMKKCCQAPLNVVRQGLDPRVCHIYQEYQTGNLYVAASDIAHGVGLDYSVTAVMNVRTGAVVADIMHNLLPPDEFAMHTLALLKYYQNPIWWPEDNNWGAVVISKAVQMGYQNFGYRDIKHLKRGWHTDEESRMELFGALIPAFNTRQITIFNYDGLLQFEYLIRNAAKNGRIEAQEGKNDDYPVAVGICVAKQGEVLEKMTPRKAKDTLHFRLSQPVRR